MSERNAECASFLKSRRRRLTPEAVGLPHGVRRRIPTLRREDVAWLADVGITWYTWLEQGRPIKIASETLDRVARALRLDISETEYLRKLVHGKDPARQHWRTPVSDAVRALVERFEDGYAFVTGPRWDILACNARFGELAGFRGDAAGLRRNVLWSMFEDPRAKRTYPNWTVLARCMVATFRVDYADYVGDEGFTGLIETLSAKSADFRAMWDEVGVLSPMRWNVGAIREPSTGRVAEYETVNLRIPGSPAQMLVFYVPHARPAT
jgi:PAS domain-containing protein